MEKFIPYEKLSKKEKRKMDLAKRQTWGVFDPVTRKPQNSKAYNRNKSRNWMRDYHETNSGTFLFKYLFQIRQIVNDPSISIKLYHTDRKCKRRTAPVSYSTGTCRSWALWTMATTSSMLSAKPRSTQTRSMASTPEMM